VLRDNLVATGTAQTPSGTRNTMGKRWKKPNQKKKPDPLWKPLECLKNLEPLSSFECTSGVLLWGQLDTVMEAKLNLDDGMFDGWAAHTDQGGFGGGTVYMTVHKFKCQAAKGKWSKYLARPGQGFPSFQRDDDDIHYPKLLVFYCHQDITPVQFLKQVRHFGFWNNRDRGIPKNPEVTKIVYVNRYDWAHLHETAFGTDWKPSGALEVVLVDSCWDMKLPPLPDDETRRIAMLEGRTVPTPEEFFKRLDASYSQKDENTFVLENKDKEACGLLSTDFNCQRIVDNVCARLLFNDEKQLIGMGFSEIGDNAIYHSTFSCTTEFNCPG